MADLSFQEEFLESHNAYRAAHGAPPLTLSDSLTASAQRWADYLLQLGQMQHSNMGTGENIYCKWGSSSEALTGREAVDKWYSEIKDYDYRYPGFRYNTGHFTQVVWRSSTELGVGVATDGHRVFVVGQYLPPGNYSNRFEDNVRPKECHYGHHQEDRYHLPSVAVTAATELMTPLCPEELKQQQEAGPTLTEVKSWLEDER
uniref:Golgi-associated plant pathogenesis-related protein 1-like n=1 Tax=Salarias fasciatus TaxID=181472 RepID=A0A672J0F4_SALFA